MLTPPRGEKTLNALVKLGRSFAIIRETLAHAVTQARSSLESPDCQGASQWKQRIGLKNELPEGIVQRRQGKASLLWRPPAKQVGYNHTRPVQGIVRGRRLRAFMLAVAFTEVVVGIYTRLNEYAFARKLSAACECVEAKGSPSCSTFGNCKSRNSKAISHSPPFRRNTVRTARKSFTRPSRLGDRPV